MIRASIAICIVLWCSAVSYPLRADLARVVVDDGTLKTPDGETLRGAPFFMDVYGVPDMREHESTYREYFQQVCRRREVNCIRINATIWHLERIDGNIYRLRSAVGSQVYLHGDYKNDEPWRDVLTADRHTDWNSQKFQFCNVQECNVEENVYQIKCLWGDLYITGRNLEDSDSSATNVRTAPFNVDWTSQQWQLIPVK